MIITGFGVTLVRLQHQDIELLRQHRNSNAISQFMALRTKISKQQQEKWFKGIDNKFNNYFLIHYDDKAIGLIYGADINWEKKETGNGGVFIWEEGAFETHAPLGASMLLTEVSFLLGMERTYIKVLSTNLRAIAYNQNLGYQILSQQEEVINQKYFLDKENYYRKAERFRRLFFKKYGDVFSILLNDVNHEAEKNIHEVYLKIAEEDKMRLKLIY
jgi:RimJ/RimL family protein N-acetyltransferase